MLRSLLPSLGNLLHDRSERVRLSVVDMLLEVRQTKGFKFYHIIPVELLLALLAAEGEGSRPVASRLTGLLLDSYFPQGQQITGAIQVQRTLSLLSSNPAAAHVFYQNLYAHISVNSIVKLILMLLKCLRASVRADQSSENRERQVQSTDENASLIFLTASNTAVMKTIAEVIWYLWNSITENLSCTGNAACKESLFEAFTAIKEADSNEIQKASFKVGEKVAAVSGEYSDQVIAAMSEILLHCRRLELRDEGISQEAAHERNENCASMPSI